MYRKEILVGVIAAVVAALILGLGGYVIVVEKNAVKITNLSKEVADVKVNVESISAKITALPNDVHRDIAASAERIARIEGIISSTPWVEIEGNSNANGSAGDLASISPERLIDIIKEAQKANVRASTGVDSYNSYTNDDLTQFTDRKRPEAIAMEESRSREFHAVVLVVKRMPPIDREGLLRAAIQPLRPTYAELGRVVSDGSGQTDAGQRAELLVAEAIVDEMQRMLKKSEKELLEAYFE